MTKKQFALLIIGCLILLGGCSGRTAIDPFASDGCSLFPDGTWCQDDLWYHCCYNHDIIYWRGGTADEREAADQALRSCVAATGKTKTATLMYYGVRAFGSPYLPFWFRWGFGWPYPRGYQALTEEEKQQIKKIQPKTMKSSSHSQHKKLNKSS